MVSKWCIREWVNFETMASKLPPGNRSDCTYMWVNLTSDPNPKVNIIRKNRTAHNGPTGICANASGYTSNARPGPKNKQKENMGHVLAKSYLTFSQTRNFRLFQIERLCR